MKKISIGVLGFGTVGYGVYRVLEQNGADIRDREDLDIHVKRILVKDFALEPNYGKAPKEAFTTDMADILADEDIAVVVECLGGVEPARAFILEALAKGKSVVTSNKEVISKHWHDFAEVAERTGAGLYIEATVGGGIPLIRALTDGLNANHIERVMGIINGTTNYILTKMSEEGRDFNEVLQKAQQKGYAEANPAADVEGYDATYKLSILSSLAFHTHVSIEAIHREGITKLTAADFHAAKQLGYQIKLLAIGKQTEKDGKRQVEVRVHPTMIPKYHPLASIRGTFNAVFLTGNAVDDVMLYGRGAGQMPTASAVVADVIYACKHEGMHKLPSFWATGGEKPEIIHDWQSIYCLRFRVADKPGVLSGISGIFAKHGVSLKSVLQLADPEEEGSKLIAWITFVTHQASELSLQAALKEMEGLDYVECVESVIRVEE